MIISDTLRQLKKQLRDLEYTTMTQTLTRQQESELNANIVQLKATINEKESEERGERSGNRTAEEGTTRHQDQGRYLFLDFTRRSGGSDFSGDYYNKSLEDQYAALAERYYLNRGYESFIQTCFPIGQERLYFVSMPDMIRSDAEKDEAQYVNNVVIRSKRDGASNFVLPKGMEIILIGDVKKNSGEFTVKGIELIDGAIYTSGEYKVSAQAVCAFNLRNDVKFPDYGLRMRIESDISVFDRDTIHSMCQSCYTVPDPSEAIRVYDEWNEYIGFRKYYLDQQGKKGIQFTRCEAVKCYVISRYDYKKDPQRYDDHILDDLDSIRKDEQVIVIKPFDDSEQFDLVRVIVEKNRKELLSETGKGGKGLEFEQRLRRFTGLEVSLVSEDEKRNVSVDERYRFLYKDIEPDYAPVEEEFAKNLKNETEGIDKKYAAVRDQNVREHVGKRTKDLEAEDKETVTAYEEKLSDNLAKDVSENKDETIRKEYAVMVKKEEDAVKLKIEKVRNQYSRDVDEVKRNKKLRGEELKESVKKLEDMLATALKPLNEEMTQRKGAISLSGLYVKRNKRMISQKESDLKRTREFNIARIRDEKRREIEESQAPDIRKEKAEAKRENEEELVKRKEEMEENLTFRRYHIYFKLPQGQTADSVNSEIDKYKPVKLKLDLQGENMKIMRQERSLNDFFNGYVKNPFLSSYLFAPQDLDAVGTSLPEIDYLSNRLNEKQKDAVKKAIASESLFLLQGPPGTGKTEVIAEVAAQLVKNHGKRVLISSETHKAIDNVFERLPKIPEIRPLRLIPSQSKEETHPFSPKHLVDNFYLNISGRLEKEVSFFKDFKKHKENFDEEYMALNVDLKKLNREKKRINDVELALKKIYRERSSLNDKYAIELEKLNNLREEHDMLAYRLREIETMNLRSDDATDTNAELIKILLKYPVLKNDPQTLIFIHKVNMDQIKKDIASLSDNSELMKLDSERAKVKKQMDALRDKDTDEIISGREKEWKKLQGQFIDMGKRINTAKDGANIDLNTLSISKIIKEEELKTDILPAIADTILNVKAELANFIQKARNEIGAEMDEKTKSHNKQKDIADKLKKQIREKDDGAQDAKDEGGYENYKETESRLKRKVSDFFEKFNIVKTYEDLSSALDIIRKEWDDLEENYNLRESENRDKIPMYERILKFLRGLQGDKSIEDDRIQYTRDLFDKANVIGLTATARNFFKEGSIESFKTYGLGDLDVKKMGIDVVIIDEVSKSSFLDLLIPILYGKTVILVGDHRQLPPMYDLNNLRAEDFEGLDPDIFDKDRNDEYAKLYEKCFFKELFEKAPERLKVMLTKQYRCHEDIMRVFNHFYLDAGGKGSLELGTPNQNDQKQHSLSVKGKSGKTILQPNKHIYFIDCNDADGGYEKFGDSKSATNEREAEVIINLTKRIDEACGRLEKPEVDKNRDIDKRMSMGVICTYRDQVDKIRRRLPKNSFKNICEKQDERFIVNTVDDFQGDERDIIFVSMVGNPRPADRKRRKADFLKKFERINVALSRARRMLVVVGSKDFLSDATIYLPDLNGRQTMDRKAYPAYREIINTIETYGSLMKAGDVLENEER